MKVSLVCYKDKINIPLEVKHDTTIEELKGLLTKEMEKNTNYKYSFYEIKLLFSSEILEDKKMLSDYKIQSGSTMFFYYKKKKAKNKGKKEENSNNQNNNIQIDKVDGENEQKGNKKENSKENLSTYSAIIKILSYDNSDNITTILRYLKNEKSTILAEIQRNKENFRNLLKMVIDDGDISFYINNYDIVIELKRVIRANNGEINENQDSKNDKYRILLSEEDEKFINLWIYKSKKRLDKETIILEYVKNKFDQNKTSMRLMEILSNM